MMSEHKVYEVLYKNGNGQGVFYVAAASEEDARRTFERDNGGEYEVEAVRFFKD